MRRVLAFIIILVVLLLAASAAFCLFRFFRNRDSDGDGYYDWQDKRPKEWDVGDRDLAILAKLAYLDGADYVGRFYPAERINEELAVLEADFAKMEPEFPKRWIIADYTQQESMGATFCATTYKNGKNLVISYRGSDDEGDWIWNFVGVGLLDFHIEEPMAKEYALSMAEQYPDCDIYITGHSLGGYLAQFGAVALIEENADNLREVVYFNGMGLGYSGEGRYSKDDKKAERELLGEFAREHRLVSYQIYGDIVSRIGSHSGEVISLYADGKVIEAFKDMGDGAGWLAGVDMLAAAFIDKAFHNAVSDYYEHYHVKSMPAYFNITHRAESFIAAISQGYRGISE